MNEENLTVEQVAEILKISNQTVWTKCRQGKLPAFKLPGSRKWLINSHDLEKLQKDLRSKKI